MKKCQSCKHYRPDKAFTGDKADKADYYAYCAAPKATPTIKFADHQRLNGRVMSFLFSTCGKNGRWHEPQS